MLEDDTYRWLTGCVLVAAAALMAVRLGEDHDGAGSAASPAIGRIPGATAGSAVGFLSGLTGVGGGVFLAPLLISFGWASPKRAAGISAPFILANSVLGLAGVLASGQRIPPDAAVLAPGALLGAAVGTWVGLPFMSERATRWMLAAIVGFAVLRLFLS